MPGRFKSLADSPPSTISSITAAPPDDSYGADLCLLRFERHAVISCLSVETRAYPIARMLDSIALRRGGC